MTKPFFTFYTLLILFSLSTKPVQAQEAKLKSAFVSANLGGFITARDGFEKVYDSKFGLVPGVSLGLPLSSRMYLYGKATYFAKNGVPVVTTISFDSTGTVSKISERKDGTAKFRQWIFNAGLYYNIFLSKEYTLGVNGGATITTFHEDQESSGGISSRSDGVGFLGCFGGLSLERNFENSPFSVFAETQYNYSSTPFIGNYGGVNLTLGVRYYFKDRRTE